MVPTFIIRNKDKVKALQPYKQTIQYKFSTWNKHLGRFEALKYISKNFPQSISRNNLFQLAVKANDTYAIDDILRLFLGTMIWGYGTTGYGAWRTREMLSTTNALNILQKVFGLVATNNVEEAYKYFGRNQLKRLGPPFFTKFFYYIGYGCSQKKYPLILDTKVYEALKYKIGLDTSQFVKSSTWWYPEGYINYINAMHEWAEELECEAHNIEVYLFKL